MDKGSFFRRILMAALVFSISIIYVFVSFRGLSTAEGMEKAQLARQIARGNFSTKVIRPVSIGQYNEKQGPVTDLSVLTEKDTYNAPLYPIVLGSIFKVFNVDDFKNWEMEKGQDVFGPDRIIVGFSALCFIIAAIFIYATARSIFDATIAGVTFFVLVTCDLFWSFTQTGLPNSMMLMLFAAALFCIYKATEKTDEEQGTSSMIFGLIAGLLLVLLCLTNWICIWLLIGYFIYSLFFIKPKGIVAGGTAVIALLAFILPVMTNVAQTGNPFGTAFYTVYNGLGSSEEVVMRSIEGGKAVPFRDLALKFVRNVFGQVSHVYEYSGYVIAAPLFFLSLMHSFKKRAVNSFKWGLCIMWACASLGMVIYGFGEDALHPTQMHYLFTGVMSAYGIAVVMILWARTSASREQIGIIRHGHLVILAVVASVPMLLSLPNTIYQGISSERSRSMWPPYHPASLNKSLSAMVQDDQYIFSDQPWAVAWYADRTAIWTPQTSRMIEQVEKMASRASSPIAGFHISPVTLGDDEFFKSYIKNLDTIPLALDGWNYIMSGGKLDLGTLAKNSKESSKIVRRYPYPYPLNGTIMMYYSAEQIRRSN